MSDCAVIVQNDLSPWDDIKGDLYHYPATYQSILTPGCNVVYYKGRMKDKVYESERLSPDPHYFGIGVVGDSILDPNSKRKIDTVKFSITRSSRRGYRSRLTGNISKKSQKQRHRITGVLVFVKSPEGFSTLSGIRRRSLVTHPGYPIQMMTLRVMEPLRAPGRNDTPPTMNETPSTEPRLSRSMDSTAWPAESTFRNSMEFGEKGLSMFTITSPYLRPGQPESIL